ncbi:DNA repair and recombination protein rad22 [Tieghemostelium lacteum]|uniref:DNA repair and recombination protein rad22 n=1 Tax=Tieghemostelium lacteum TaxID=361077 RepID=A0A152A7W1_TIELA|nr:DNA repair and recombination protein rad22 [Tieghemostelium lacteum]|eukprot:KYR02306.1 DNA repair and recombination protein rad22 [Tieghemostelium lacteum]
MDKTNEIIYFKSPLKESCLFLSDLHSQVTVADIEDRFKPFGLIHVVNLVSGKGCAIVRYYSIRSARDAHQSLRGKILFNGSKAKLSFSSSQITDTKPLLFHKCIDLLNYYCEFNGWSSAVEAIKVQDQGKRTLENGQEVYFCNTIAQVNISFKNGGLKFSCLGQAECEDPSQPDAIKQSKKVSVTNARQEIFSRLAIILMDNQPPLPYLLDPSILPTEHETFQPYIDEEDNLVDDIDNYDFLIDLVPTNSNIKTNQKLLPNK